MPFKNPHPLYHIWQGIRRRCLNQKFKQFHDYGGRGIYICDRWDSFQNFVEDMGPRPDGYSIDRIDNNGPYSPDNCRWADKRTQQRNQRRAVFVTIGGETHRAIELAEIAGVKTDTIVKRAKAGLPYEMVVSPDRLLDTEGLVLGVFASGERKRSETHCKHGHEYTTGNTSISPQGWRRCKTCHREKVRRLNAAKKAKHGGQG